MLCLARARRDGGWFEGAATKHNAQAVTSYGSPPRTTDTREREELRAKRVFAEVFNSQI